MKDYILDRMQNAIVQTGRSEDMTLGRMQNATVETGSSSWQP